MKPPVSAAMMPVTAYQMALTIENVDVSGLLPVEGSSVAAPMPTPRRLRRYCIGARRAAPWPHQYPMGVIGDRRGHGLPLGLPLDSSPSANPSGARAGEVGAAVGQGIAAQANLEGAPVWHVSLPARRLKR